MLILVNGNSFTSCVLGIIYVGAMSILFIVFLSYTGVEVEISTKNMSSIFSLTSYILSFTVCFTPFFDNSVIEVYNYSIDNENLVVPPFFYHLYTSYYILFIVMLIALLIGLMATLILVGVSRWGKK